MTAGDTFDDYLDAVAYEPATLLAKLKAKASQKTPVDRPDELTVRQIKRLPELFQPRHTKADQRHIQELARAVRNVGALDPILVMYVGRHPYLIDGHHRLAAYELAGVTAPVPVEHFQGTIDEAVLAAGRENSKAKLPMTSQERQNFAWRLVLLGTYSKRQTIEAAGVSDGQVAIMRRVKTTLGNAAYGYKWWFEALRRARGIDDQQWSDEDRQTWREEQAAWLAEQIARVCGPKFTRDTEVTAMALGRLFGGDLGSLYAALSPLVGEVEEEEEDSEY